MKMTNTKKSEKMYAFRVIYLLVFVTLILCSIASYVVFKSCIFLNCVEDRSFNALDLELPSDLFPVGATVTPIHRPSDSQGAFESASMSFFWETGNKSAGFDVWRYRTEKGASRTFLAESGGERYSEHEKFFHQSPVANEYSVGCGQLQYFGYRCNMAARYQEYTVNLIASIDDEMTLEMFNEVIIYIDREMERRLYGQYSE